MNLIDLINGINDVDEDSIIFMENINDYKSEIILSYPEDGDNGIKIERGKKFNYLIEIFLAKEFIEDWINSLNYTPSKDEIAKRLYEYGINDA
ncbi:hypothetical protein GSF70_11930 [Flavobacteriaceae bacterium W22]|nr:hypothetical protein [Flavobacteriaceae bacterium W22]